MSEEGYRLIFALYTFIHPSINYELDQSFTYLVVPHYHLFLHQHLSPFVLLAV